MNQFFKIFTANTVFANLIMIIILVAGILSANLMIKEEMPNMELETVTISVSYPGADPEEIEEGITLKIEEAIDGVEGIDSYTSSSSEGSCSVTVNVQKGYDTDSLVDRLKNKVDAISDFPDDAEKPIVSKPTIKHSVMTIYLSSNMSERRMKEWSTNIKDEIQKLSEVSQVSVSSTRDYEISIELTEAKLRAYGITLSDVSNAVKNSSLNKSGGTIKTKNEEIKIRTLGRKYNGNEIGSIVVVADKSGELITLDKIATIKDTFVDEPLKTIIDGKPGVVINIYKTEQEDSIVIANAVKKYIEEKNSQFPEGSKIGILADNSVKTTKTIDLLINNGIIGLIFVFVLLWFFLDTKLSIWAGMGIPISLAGGLSIMWLTGSTLNMMSLFGLIMVLGIVADDAIIVGEAIYVHRQNGLPPLQAAIQGAKEVALPVIAAVLTTVVAFIPLGHIDGVMGKFVVVLPIAVISCLFISLVESLVLLPAHLSDIPDPNRKKESKYKLINWLNKVHDFTSNGMEIVSKRYYLPFVRKTVNYRYIIFSIAVFLLLITVGLFQGGFLRYQVFPARDGYIVTAQIEYPEGTSFDITQKAVKKVEAAAKRMGKKLKTKSGDPLIKTIYTQYGQTLGKGLGKGGDNSSNVGGVRLILLNAEDRGMHSEKILIEWQKEVGTIHGVKSLTYSAEGKGPPGAPVEICLDGKNLSHIEAAEKKVMGKLSEIKGVTQVYSDNAPGKNVISFKLKNVARAYGLTVDDLASQVYAGYYGSESLTIQRDNEDIKAYVRYSDKERKSLSSIENFMIRTDDNTKIPLNMVADINYGPGYSTITRADGYRRITVSAEIDESKISAGDIIKDLSQSFFSDIESEYSDVSVVLEGDAKRNRKTFSSLYIWFPLAVFAIYMIVATMFKSYIQPFIILTTIPFGLIGAAWGHFFLNHVVSMLSVFGMVALTGVVVNDAIVMIDKINQNMREQIPFMEAVCLAGERRFRAVMLTSITTVGGLVPLIVETSPDAQMLIPMAISLAAGVTFATVLTLVLIPALMVILNDMRIILNIIIHGEIKTREEVEPKYTIDEKLELLEEPLSV